MPKLSHPYVCLFVMVMIMVMVCSSGGAADSRVPARFRVRSTVVAPDPGAYTATMGEGPVNSWMGIAAWEPMMFRRLFFAKGDSASQIILSKTEIDMYDSIHSGLWDGARVRVYRIVNGRLVKIREDRVRHHRASGWNKGAMGLHGRLIAPDCNTAKLWLDPWSRRGVKYYFCVRAVNQAGEESADSNVVAVDAPVRSPKKGELPKNRFVRSKRRKHKSRKKSAPAAEIGNNTPVAKLPAPAGLRASVDRNTGVITLSWQPVKIGEVGGYMICQSDYAPAQQEGFGIDLVGKPADSAKVIKTNDMIFLDKEFFSWDRKARYSNRVFGSHQGCNPPLTPFDNGVDKTWKYVPHPGPIPPEFKDRGRTCLFMNIRKNDKITLKKYNNAGINQHWYKVLTPDRTYVVEFWARQEGLAEPKITFCLTGAHDGRRKKEKGVQPLEFMVSGKWKKYRGTFKVKFIQKQSGVGQMCLVFTGPGKVWLDNWRVYEQGTDYMDFPQVEYEALRKSHLAFLRTHAVIKTPFGYSMENYTNPVGVSGPSGTGRLSEHTLPSFLRIMRKAHVNPWLQIEMCMAEDEWQGLVEYLAASFDPKVDNPAKKHWAHKRFMQGHPAPWINDFDRFLLEISNETWNRMFRPWCFNWHEMTDAATGRVFRNGEIYGIFQEYVISIMKQSPYWTPAVAKKVQFVYGGWAIQTGENGYGQQAASTGRSTRHVLVAGYNGGWDEKEKSLSANDAGFYKILCQVNQVAIPRTMNMLATLDQQRKKGISYFLGTYEAGPGYSLPNTISKAQVEQESRAMKSLAAGTATLDNFLVRGYYGFRIQNFFTFSRNRNFWSSHARLVHGGQAYPAWKLLSLYNREGAGDFLLVQTAGVPTTNLAPTRRRRGVENAPLIAVYVTRRHKRYNVFVISRKLDHYPDRNDDGFTPVRIDLPFAAPKSITLYRMEGDPRAHNLDSDKVGIVKREVPAAEFTNPFVLSEKTGAHARGLPPAATYLYVFEGCEAVQENGLLAEIVPAAGQSLPASNPDMRMLINFNKPVREFSAGAVRVSGTAGAIKAAVSPAAGSHSTSFLVRPIGVLGDGSVDIELPAGVVKSIDGKLVNAGAKRSIQFKMPEGVALRLLAWDFADGLKNRYKDRAVPSTYNLPVVRPSKLISGPRPLLGDNGYYNMDGVGAWAFGTEEPDPKSYYEWSLTPASGRRICITRVKVGLYCLSKTVAAKVLLSCSNDNFATSIRLNLVAPAPIVKQQLRYNSGIMAVADCSKVKELQNLDKPVTFRIQLFGFKKNVVAGLGKIGYNGKGDDIVVEGKSFKQAMDQ